MNSRQLFALARVNLRYLNPQVTDRLRKKGKSGRKLTQSIINQYLFSGAIFIFVYAATMFAIDYSKMPGFFTYYCALFAVLGFSQGISGIYNIFFESRDLVDYLPLPFRQFEIFLSKILVVAITIIPFMLPLLVLNFLTGLRSGVNLFLNVICSLFSFLLMSGYVFVLSSFVVFLLTRLKFFQTHKKALTSVMLFLTMAVVLISVFWMNSQTTSVQTSTTGFSDRPALKLLLPFYMVVHAPFSVQGLLSLAGIILVLALGLLLLRVLIVPRIFDQMIALSTPGARLTRKHKANQNLRQILFGYNFRLIQNPNLIMQVFSSSLMMPLIFFVSFAFSGHFSLAGLSPRYFGVFFVSGFILSFLIVNQASFVANIISLDRENFDYVKALPLSQRIYLSEKFIFAALLQIALTLIVGITGILIFKVPLLHGISLLIGMLLSTFVLSLHFFARDYRLLLTNWTSITQLFARGGGTLGQVLRLMGTMLIGVIVIVLYALASASFLPLWTHFLVIAVIFGAGGIYLIWNWKRFWNQLGS